MTEQIDDEEIPSLAEFGEWEEDDEFDEFDEDAHSVATEEEIAELVDDATQETHEIELTFCLWTPTTKLWDHDKPCNISLQCHFSEIEGKEPYEIRSMLFITGSNGQYHFFLLPEHFSSFLLQNKNSAFIFYDNAYQTTALASLLKEESEELLDLWWDMFDNSQIRDCMILDSLIRYLIFIYTL